MKKQLFLTSIVLAAVIGAFVWAANATKDTPATNKLQLAATYYPLYDFAKQVGGDKVAVTNITPAGTEPHDYDPSPKVLANASKASVFVYNGGDMEPWASKFLASYKHTAVKASEGIQLKAGQDPHFWLDPNLAQQIVANIRDGLVDADPANKAYYQQNATAYISKLKQLDADFAAALATCQQDTVISSHEAFSYVAGRYNFTAEPIAGISPEEEPAADRLAQLSDLVKQKGIQYIFFESLVSPRLADTIAQETGAKTLVFDPIEGLSNEDQKQGKDYLKVQRENIGNLRTALACQ